MPHQLPKLTYAYDALEPYLDARTMEIHHTKHHQAYVNNLNKALENYSDFQEKSLTDLIKSLNEIPETIRTVVKNNAGGHFNHSFYWQIMGPAKDNKPIKEILSAIEKSFSNFDNFKKEFSDKAAAFFGSGWIWLVSNKDKNLKIITTQGHDNPIMTNEKPLLVLDVWEHAYYLKFQNRRQEFIENWWNVINWNKVQENLTAD